MQTVLFKFFGYLINLDHIFLITFFAGMILFFTRFKKTSRGFLITSFSLMILIISPIGMIGTTFLENRFPRLQSIPADAKGLILLGGSFDRYVSSKRDTISFNMAAGRIFDFAALAKKNPDKQIVFTGAGRGLTPKVNESALAKEVFDAYGIDTSKVIFENKSADTTENAKFTRDILQPKPGEKWVLVTSAFHMSRSVALFKKMGFDVIPYPVDYHTDGEYHLTPVWDLYYSALAWKTFIREIASMTNAYLFGSSDEWMPGPK